MLLDFISRFVALLVSAGVVVLYSFLLPDAEQIMDLPLTNTFWVQLWISISLMLLIAVVNVVAGVLPVRAAIRRTQADARRRLGIGA